MPVSLLDIAPPEVASEKVDIRGTKLSVRAISNLEMAVLYKRFPVFAKQVASDARRLELLAIPKLTEGQAAELDRLTVLPEDGLACDAEMRPVMIAASLGELGNEKFEAGVSERLSKEEQSGVLSVVMRLTYPNRVGDRAIGLEGSALFLTYRDPATGTIEHVWAGIAGRDGILPGTWYTLDREGRPIKAPADPLAPGAGQAPAAETGTITQPQ
jgi:hypothetical protein